MKKKIEPAESWKHGLSERHIAQIIRRSMIMKVVPSKRNFKRKKYRHDEL